MTSPYRQFHPRLSTTLSLVVCALLLFMGVISWLVVPLLSGIDQSSGQTRERYMPSILDHQRNALKVEKISGYLNTVYWAQDPDAERRARLQAQVLIQSFMLEETFALAGRTAETLDIIKRLMELRERQRRQMEQVALLLGQSGSPALAGLGRWLLLTPLREVRWPPFAPLLAAIPAPDDEDRIRLQRLARHLQQVSILNSQADQLLERGQAQLQQVAGALTTDAALRVQQLTEDIGRDAGAVARYTYLLIGVVTLISVLLFGALHRFVLRPLQASLQGLRAIEQDHNDHVRLPPVLFSELNTICRAVEDYSAMTRELRQLNEELQQLSHQDGLTGLANRRHFDQVLHDAFNRARRHHARLAVVMLDIDHFKRLNDTFGHLNGDECLRALARVLKDYALRSGEVAARYGGEEFALVLTDVNRQQLVRLCEQIRQQVAALQLVDGAGQAMPFTVSLGAALLPAAALEQECALLQLADQALYRAKQEGRNRVVLSEGETRPAQALA